MADEQHQLGQERIVPKGLDWPSLLERAGGGALEAHYYISVLNRIGDGGTCPDQKRHLRSGLFTGTLLRAALASCEATTVAMVAAEQCPEFALTACRSSPCGRRSTWTTTSRGTCRRSREEPVGCSRGR